MIALIFPDRTAYDTFEAKMAVREGIPKPGRNAQTREIVDPGRKTGQGWTTRYARPIDERDGPRVMTRIDDGVALDAGDTALIETRQPELDKFGPVRRAGA